MVVLLAAVSLYFPAFMTVFSRISMFLAKYVTIIMTLIYSLLNRNTLQIGVGRSFGTSNGKDGDLGTYKDSSGFTRVVKSDGYARNFVGNRIGKIKANGKVQNLRAKDN